MFTARGFLILSASMMVVGSVAIPRLVAAQSSTTGNTIVCESADGEYHRCDVTTQGNVQLVRKLSWVACEQGKSWGFDPRGIWVDQGCSAEFRYGRATAATTGASTAKTLVCESKNGQYRYCQAPTQGTAQLRRRLSSDNCVEGDSWGYDNGGIWVSDNCRAEFAYGKAAATSSVGNKSAAKPAGRLTCESVGGAQKVCPADTQGNVRLVQQLSRTACVQNQTWGFDSAGIWVSGGCRAQFDYGVAKAAGTAASTAAAGAAATSVTCESAGDQGKRCKIGDTSKVTVRLQKQLSRSPCTEDDTWGVDNHSLWVTGGCRAQFTVTPTAAAAGSSTDANTWNQPGSGDNAELSNAAARVPSWLIGSFNGYNPLYDAGMQLTISRDGKVAAIVEGARLNGWYEEGKMVLGGVEYTVRRDQNGFRTIQENDPGNQVVYTRSP